MAKTESAKAMDDLPSRLRPFLKEHGFRMQARTCNRTTSDGLTHVINFQMGHFDPPGTNFIAGFRENRYGCFTVNVGVYVPEIAVAQHYWVKPRVFAQEVDCCIRVRLAQLSGESDLWWKLPAGERTIANLHLRFERDAFPYLSRLQDRDSVLQELDRGGSFAPRIPRAIILAARGELDSARDLLREQMKSSNSLKHSEYVRELANRLGLGQIEL
jgi:hypothetical protein